MIYIFYCLIVCGILNFPFSITQPRTWLVFIAFTLTNHRNSTYNLKNIFLLHFSLKNLFYILKLSLLPPTLDPTLPYSHANYN